MIRFAKPADHPQLHTLWEEAFGDPKEAISAYFLHRHADENLLVDVQNGTVTGMLSMLPVTLKTSDGQHYPARYLYAVATRSAYRGQGISTALLHAAHEHMQLQGVCASVLVPGGAELFRFYEKRGYQPYFYFDELTVSSAELPPLPKGVAYGDCSAEDYTKIRDTAFQNSSLYACWDEAAIAYAVTTFARPGGVLRLSWAGGQGCAAWEQAGDAVLVRELALLQGDVLSALSLLHDALQFERYTVRLMRGSVPDAVVKPFGMIRWLTAEPTLSGSAPYLSLAMD